MGQIKNIKLHIVTDIKCSNHRDHHHVCPYLPSSNAPLHPCDVSEGDVNKGRPWCRSRSGRWKWWNHKGCGRFHGQEGGRSRRTVHARTGEGEVGQVERTVGEGEERQGIDGLSFFVECLVCLQGFRQIRHMLIFFFLDLLVYLLLVFFCISFLCV